MATSASDWVPLGDSEREHYRLSADAVDMTRPAPPPLTARMAAQPQNVLVDLRKSALIVIDMQNDFCNPEGWLGSLGADVSPMAKLFGPINTTLAAFRRAQAPIIWVNWGVRADKANLLPATRYPFHRVGCGVGLADPPKMRAPGAAQPRGVLQKDSWGAAVVSELDTKASDIFVDKHRISGFWDTPLDSILRNLNARTLFFAGVNADHCVLATLMDASFCGYDTILIEDCTATSSPDFCLQATLHNVRFCFGFTVRHEDLVSAFKSAS